VKQRGCPIDAQKLCLATAIEYRPLAFIGGNGGDLECGCGPLEKNTIRKTNPIG
jgi:hypothetical protein